MPDFPVKNAAQPVFGDATILRTTDLGATWTPVSIPPGTVGAVAPDPVAAQVLFAGTNIGNFKTSDGGQTWLMVYPFQPNLPLEGSSLHVPLVIDPGNHLRLAALDANGSLIRSIDGGNTWTAPLSVCAGQLFADPSGSGALVMMGSILYLSRDWGLTFNPIGPPSGGILSAATMVPSHPGWIYTDGGQGTLGTLFFSTANAYSAPGFVSALFQIPVQVPASVQNGTDVGNGVQRVPFYLTPYSPLVTGITPPPSSVIGVYVH